jgi:cytochrome c oxidase assembly factor CtaG
MQHLSGHRLSGRARPRASLWRGLTWCMASLAGLAAAAIAAVLAVFFAATMMVIAFMASILLALAAAAVRARRSLSRTAADPDVIEARHVGGHSWVAYGWDDRR